MFENGPVELLEIRQSVRKLAQAEIPAYQNESYYGTVPLELFKKLSELGLAGLSTDEQYGGSSGNPCIIAAVIEELARQDLGPAIFLGVHLMVSGLINRNGTEAQKEKYLPRLASGEWLGAYALTEPTAGSDAASLKTTAKKDNDIYLLNGEKCYITSAGWANLYIVFARTDSQAGKDGISAFIVEASSEGLDVSPPEKKMGCELSPIASVRFNDVKVPEENLLGELNKGYRLALAALAGGRVNIAAAANGLSGSAIKTALSHLKERKQFGRALIEFQGLQFMLADMKMKYEAAKLLTEKAALALTEHKPSERIDCSIAKCFATDAAMQITTDAVQLLGGAGYIKDYKVERLMRDAKMLQIVEGTNQIQRMLIAREMAKE
ncbi:MAG: acyl-CoA dehydrogenase [Candidatus Dadabacteria bacterium]|nr:MAG: acyl-CoA dehydrogenase [Candidatus Dadabacteria bacterium]